MRALRVPAGSTSTGAPVDGGMYATAGAVGACSIVPSYPYHLSTAEVYTAAAAVTQVGARFVPRGCTRVVVGLPHCKMIRD